MSRLKGDFIGFTFNNIHSSSLGIHRVNKGDRAEEALLPVSKDTTVERTGADGTFFFGSKYTQRVFDFEIAYDDMTEAEKQRLSEEWYDGKIHDLIFDEVPYKIYSAKINGQPKLNFICFDDDNGQRIYKGEGTVSFICYTPFARSRYKYLDQYTIDSIPEWKRNAEDEEGYYKNIEQWKNSLPFLESQQPIDSHKFDIVQGTGDIAYIYNPTSIKTEPILYIEGIKRIENGETVYDYDLKLSLNSPSTSISIKGTLYSRFIRINNKNCLIENISNNDYNFIRNPVINEGLFVKRIEEEEEVYYYKIGRIDLEENEPTYDLNTNVVAQDCTNLFYNGNYISIHKSFDYNNNITCTYRDENIGMIGHFVGIIYDYKFV